MSMMGHRGRQSFVDDKVREVLKRLDKLVERLEDYQALLKQNVMCTKFQMRANFNSLAELLTERQCTLLAQLQNIEKEKGILIEGQRQTIESLRNAILSSSTARSDVDTIINEYVKRAESIVLTPNLNPFVTFKAESAQLSHIVSGYGRLASRYPGHFADPSQPSTCLPRDLEEEEDHVDTHTQSTIFGRMNSCSCVDPKLRPWLSTAEHKCKRKRSCESVKNDEHTKNRFNSSPYFNSLNPQDYAPVSKCLEGSLRFNPSKLFSRSCFPPDSSLVRTWLGSGDEAENSGILHKSEQMSRLTSLDQSNHEDDISSEDFDVVTGSNLSNNLKDWLFSDFVELRDMPGLSTNIDVPNGLQSIRHHSWSTNNSNSEVSVKLSKLSIRSCETERTVPLLPAELTEQTIDMDRWLTHSEKQVPDQSADANEKVTIIPEATNCATDDENQHCPAYGQCIGGPGGPTCCKGGFIPSKLNSDLSETVEKLKESKTDSTDIVTPTHKPVSAVVSQLDRIANSDLKLWISNGRLITTSNRDVESFENAVPESDWLATHQSDEINLKSQEFNLQSDNEDILIHEPNSPPKCCNLLNNNGNKIDSPQSPFLSQLDFNDNKSVFPKNFTISQKSLTKQQNSTITTHLNYDNWLR